MLRPLCLTWTIKDDVLLITTPEQDGSMLSTKVYDVSDLVACRDEHDAPWDDYETLIDIINSTIQPTSWDEVGGPGSNKGASLGTAKVLVVSQTYRTHCQIAKLLAEIREIAKKNPNGGPPRRNQQSKQLPSGLPGLAAGGAQAAPKPDASRNRGGGMF